MQYSLKHQVLVANPNFKSPPFSKSVIYIFNHDESGASGIMLNHLIQPMLSDLIQQIEIDSDEIEHLKLHANLHRLSEQFSQDATTDRHLFFGGPTNPERGYILFKGTSDHMLTDTLYIEDDLYITSSRNALLQMAKYSDFSKTHIALGNAQWASNQLELEIQDNMWFNIPSDQSLIFEIHPNDRWEHALVRAGIKPGTIILKKSGRA